MSKGKISKFYKPSRMMMSKRNEELLDNCFGL